MKIIEEMIEDLEEEVEGAEEYAERYIESRARGDMSKANRFKEMANDELKHAGYIRDMSIVDVEELKKVYTMNTSEEEKWRRGLKCANEKMAVVKNMLGV